MLIVLIFEILKKELYCVYLKYLLFSFLSFLKDANDLSSNHLFLYMLYFFLLLI